MELTIAPNPKAVQKSQPITSADPHLDTVNTEQGATAGMPVFLHRSGVSQATTFLQPKLTVNELGDQYEQEADRVADQVMRMPEPTIQRQVEPGEEEEEMVHRQAIPDKITPLIQRQVSPEIAKEDVIQTKATNSQTTTPASTQASLVAPSSVYEALSSPGQPLDPATRVFMEQRFGHDFSQVRVHSGGAAEQSAQDVSANAYTVGYNVVFGKGRFAPGTQEGRQLIAHELTHVVQQTDAAPLQTKPDGSSEDTATPDPDRHLTDSNAYHLIQLQQQRGNRHVQQLVQQNTILRSPVNDITHSPNLKFQPQEVRLPDAIIGTTVSASCRIENLEDQPIVLDDLESDNLAFKVDLKSNAIPAQGQLTFEIGFTPPAEGHAEALVTASLPLGPVAYLRVHGTGHAPKPAPPTDPQPGNPRYNPLDQFKLPAPQPGDPRYVPLVYGPVNQPPAPEPAKLASPAPVKPAPPPKPVVQPQLKPVVARPASLEFTTTPNYDPIRKSIRIENPNDVQVQVDLLMDGTAQSAAFFVREFGRVIIGPHQGLDPAFNVFFLPGASGKSETTVSLSETAAGHAPRQQNIHLKGIVQEEKPVDNRPGLTDLAPFDTKSWVQARKQLQQLRTTVDSIDREYQLWVPNHKKAADAFSTHYTDSVGRFQILVQALLTEDTVKRLESLRPSNVESIVSFLLDFPLAFAPPIVGIAKDALFLIDSIRANNESNRQIDVGIAKTRDGGSAVSVAITALTYKAVREMKVGSNAMEHAEGEWHEMVTGEKKMLLDWESELEKSPSSAQNIKRAKEVYEAGAALMIRFRSAEVQFAEGLRYIAERSTRIDGELDKIYHEIEVVVNGPAPALDKASGTIEITVTPDGPTPEEIRRQLAMRDIEVKSIVTKPWQATGYYDRRRNMVFVLEAEATRNLSPTGVVRSATESLQTRQGVLYFNVTFH